MRTERYAQSNTTASRSKVQWTLGLYYPCALQFEPIDTMRRPPKIRPLETTRHSGLLTTSQHVSKELRLLICLSALLRTISIFSSENDSTCEFVSLPHIPPTLFGANYMISRAV